MNHLNIEIKARSNNHEAIRMLLKENGAVYKGIDHQIDTYFNVSNGRMKLREGNIENSLVHYNREDKGGPKKSEATIFEIKPNSPLKEILIKALGVLVVVDKKREIYFIDNIKFHIDIVEGLGTFIEIEAIDDNGAIGKDKLFEQCQFYLEEFDIAKEDLISASYSDLLLQMQ
jgi:predicted adenylyl cyclase CyaB